MGLMKDSAGTEPSIFEAAMKPKMPSIAARPLLISTARPRFDFSADMSPQRPAVEINNGRAAMLGIFGFMAASKIDGSVPALSFIKPYAGNYMSPFEGNYDLFA